MSIGIKALDGVTFEVTITAPTRTAHIVTVSDAYYQTLTRGTMSKEQLIAFSFDFLLLFLCAMVDYFATLSNISPYCSAV